MKENKYICIWYSWGDIESPFEVPEGKDAFDFMVELALEEVRVTIVENEEKATIWIDEDENVVLNYHYDNEYCHYRIFKNEKEANKFYDNFMKMKFDKNNIS